MLKPASLPLLPLKCYDVAAALPEKSTDGEVDFIPFVKFRGLTNRQTHTQIGMNISEHLYVMESRGMFREYGAEGCEAMWGLALCVEQSRMKGRGVQVIVPSGRWGWAQELIGSLGFDDEWW